MLKSCINILLIDGSNVFLNDGRLGNNHVLEAIVSMKEPEGSDRAASASYIEVFLLYFTSLMIIKSKHPKKQIIIKILML